MVTSFPNTLCYSIHFEQGASGNFLATLITKFLYGTVPFTLSNHGKIFNHYNVYYSNYKPRHYIHEISYKQFSFDEIEPIDKSRAIIFTSHENPNLQKFFEFFPLGHIIKVQITKEMKSRVILNNFYKNFVEDFKTDYGKKEWLAWRVKYDFLKDLDDPTSLNYSQIVDYFNKLDYKDEIFEIPTNFSSNVIPMLYKDVIYNKIKVLQTISKITNKPVTNSISKFYDKWLSKQNQLMPL